jgi:hypothetical protein
MVSPDILGREVVTEPMAMGVTVEAAAAAELVNDEALTVGSSPVTESPVPRTRFALEGTETIDVGRYN